MNSSGTGMSVLWRGSWRMVLKKRVKKTCTSSISPAMYLSSSTFTGPISCASFARSPSCTAEDTTLPPMRWMNPRPLLPSAQKSASMPAACHSLYCWSTIRSTLVFSPPHRPLSVVTTITPTRFTWSRFSRNGWRYSALALETCIAICSALATYGRVARMRSCDFFIFEAATISMALVIFRVFCTLRIFTRISLVPGTSEAPVLLPVFDRGLQAFFFVRGKILLVLDRLHLIGVLRLQVVAQRLVRRQRLGDLQPVEVAVVHREQRHRHLPHRERLVQRLLHQLGHQAPAVELPARGVVEVGGELRERRQLAVLREREAHAAARVLPLHDLGLGGAADARYRDAGVNRRADARVEQVGLEEDLAVGDRDHVRRNERGDVARLRLDDRERGERPGLAFDCALRELLDVLLVHPRAALQEPRVQVEHVAGIRLAPRGTAKQQRDLTVRPGLLREVVVDDERVLAAVAEVLAHGAAGIGRDVLHRGGLGCRGGDDDGVRHRAVLFELADHVRDRRGLLADRDVDADQVLALLVDDGVDRDRGLAGLAVADDQLALAAADRHHRVDRLEAGLHRLGNRLPRDHARGDLLDDVARLGVDRALAVDRGAERVHDAPEQLGADRHLENPPGALHRVALGDVLVLAQNHRADRVALEVEREAEGVLREFQHLALHHVGQPVDAADAVGDGDDRPLGANVRREREVLDLAADQVADLGWVELLHRCSLDSLTFQRRGHVF